MQYELPTHAKGDGLVVYHRELKYYCRCQHKSLIMLSPKEKAKELYGKYEFVSIQNHTSKHEVKQCIMVAIDEIYEAINWHELEIPNKEWDYWNDVKLEVELL